MSHEQQTSKPQKEAVPASAVIAWEQPVEHKPDSVDSKVISIDSYRRQGISSNESEATVNIREFQTNHGAEPIHLIIVSSGFGQKLTVHSHTVQSKAAAA